jgi:plastin-1
LFSGDSVLILYLFSFFSFYFRYTLGVLSELGRYQGIPEITEDHIVRWAQGKVASTGKQMTMKSFRDSTLKNSMFLLELVAVIEPRAVDWEVVNREDNHEAHMLNAKYCISAARKIGACVFLTPEDIVEVKSKMILTFVAGLWMADLVRFQPTVSK